MQGFLAIPADSIVRLRDARIPAALLIEAPPCQIDSDGLAAVDLEIQHGQISAIAPAGTFEPKTTIDLAGGQVWPGYADIHTHLDKGFILPRATNPDRTFKGAFTNVAADRAANWTADDLRRRFDFALRCAYAHGTTALRTHIDSLESQAYISWGVFREMRELWAGRIELQASSLVPIDVFGTPYGKTLADIVAVSGGNLGAVTRLTGGIHDTLPAEFEALLDRVFTLADERGLDLDFHVDESGELGAKALAYIASVKINRHFQKRVLCGHCCSLAVQSESYVKTTLNLCADAGIAVVSLPMCNQYLQDRQIGRTPRWRGVTLLHEMRASGIEVAVASDNTIDPFFGYGDLDMHEVFTQAVRIAHLDTPYGDWPRAATATPAAIMGLYDHGMIGIGRSADLILFRGRSMNELLSRPQADRVVLRAGRIIDTTLPDHRELDDLFQIPALAPGRTLADA